ncbi:PREDICTED: zinc finger BED domain-containing protein 1-like [Amphimedon queenslandica]|nr:PREDICTED: zinc finger BED domain-containing protein 1-like [Amphimedon queenslandica]|eukprot:XP_019858685.1 PREDICTED: zinc finger BED domain-containing protein 1-like [Amphimedon queenslandica]
MTAAIREMGWRHLPCFAHSLNLVVQDAMKLEQDLTGIKERCKQIVSHFHRSAKSSDKLAAIQKQLAAPEHKLIQEVCTRWNSTYLMFQRYVEQHEAVTATLCLLGHNALCLSSDDVTTISKSLAVLAPFLEATENISADQYVSVSLILPLKKLLQQQCCTSYRTSSTPLAELLADELESRFSALETSYLSCVTTFLDPRLKKIPFSSQTSVEHTTNRIIREMTSHEVGSTGIDNSAGNSGSSTQSTEPSQSLWNTFDRSVAESTSHRNTGTDCIIRPNISRLY